jgi:hypothetical protein
MNDAFIQKNVHDFHPMIHCHRLNTLNCVMILFDLIMTSKHYHGSMAAMTTMYHWSSRNKCADEKSISNFHETLLAMKEELNRVKSHLSDKDIAEWNRSLSNVDVGRHDWHVYYYRHTAYMNHASMIVPYLREHIHVELGTQAWAKMYEILVRFDLISCIDDSTCTSLHLCEAPGGFISALNHYLVTQRRYFRIDRCSILESRLF